MHNSTLHIKSLEIKSFRCFESKTIDLDSPIVLIEGDNGSGKSSLLEAIHYLCYLRSFRTHRTQELVNLDKPGFFIKATFSSSDKTGITQDHELQVGFEGKERLVKLNRKSIRSYKELMDHFRVVTLTEHDLTLVQGAPEVRRSFIDQVLLLQDPSIGKRLRAYKAIVAQRNALLNQMNVSRDLYMVWTEQLFVASRELQQKRIDALSEIEEVVNKLLQESFDESFHIRFGYIARKKSVQDSLKEFLALHPTLQADEQRFRRSLFGAHLDDFSIDFQDKKSRAYASRGQQKLIVLLIKVAQLQQLSEKKGAAIFLLDDFMTDFDEEKVDILIPLLRGLGAQLVFTTPSRSNRLSKAISQKPHLKLELPN